jgi:hypothetical protein
MREYDFSSDPAGNPVRFRSAVTVYSWRTSRSACPAHISLTNCSSRSLRTRVRYGLAAAPHRAVVQQRAHNAGGWHTARVARWADPARCGFNPYQRQGGAAYYDAPEQAGEAPLYCVSPGNGLPVTGWRKEYGPNEKPAQQAPTKECLTSYQPPKPSSFLKRLSFQASIGQAF